KSLWGVFFTRVGAGTIGRRSPPTSPSWTCEKFAANSMIPRGDGLLHSVTAPSAWSDWRWNAATIDASRLNTTAPTGDGRRPIVGCGMFGRSRYQSTIVPSSPTDVTVAPAVFVAPTASATTGAR